MGQDKTCPSYIKKEVIRPMKIKLLGRFNNYDEYLRGMQFSNGISISEVAATDVAFLKSEGIPFEYIKEVCADCEVLKIKISELEAQLAKAKKK